MSESTGLSPAATLSEEQARHLARYADQVLIPRAAKQLRKRERCRRNRARLAWLGRVGGSLEKVRKASVSIGWLTLALVAAEGRGLIDLTALPAWARLAMDYLGGLA